MTVGLQGGRILPIGPGIGATQLACALMSFTRAAGLPPIFTVNEPLLTSPGPAGTQPGREQIEDIVPTVAAGRKLISTVGMPPEIKGKGKAGWAEGVGTGAAG